MVLGYSRLIWARFVLHQDLQTVLRCHMAAFESIGGAPKEILYDRMKTAVLGEDPEGLVVYNRALVDLARHYEFQLSLELAMEYLHGTGRSFRAERVPLCFMRRVAWACTETRKII